MLLVDCLRADHVGAYGATRPATPNLDRLARDGVVFDRAFAVASWTRPSVPSILTGLYPSEHGLAEFEQEADGAKGNALAPAVETVAEGLRAGGYATALIGEQYQLSRQFGMDQGFDLFENNVGNAAKIDAELERWLAERPGQPFFAYLHYLDIHWPYCPPPGTAGTFDDGTSQIDFCKGWRRLRERIRTGEQKLSPADVRAMQARYDEELLALDRHVGELFAALAASGRWDETLVVVLSDHGEEFLERGNTGHGQSLFDELTHTPLIVKPPKSWRVPGGRRVEGLLETRSVAPTLLDSAGLRIPSGVSAPSLLPWILDRSPTPAPAEFVVAESNGLWAVRTNDWKLVLEPRAKKIELFDLGADPGERHDLAASRPEQREAMQALLRRWRAGLKPVTPAAARTLDKETEEGLRALGYLR